MATGDDRSRKELHRSRSGLRMLSNDGTRTSPFLISEPPWTSDSEVWYDTPIDRYYKPEILVPSVPVGW